MSAVVDVTLQLPAPPSRRDHVKNSHRSVSLQLNVHEYLLRVPVGRRCIATQPGSADVLRRRHHHVQHRYVPRVRLGSSNSVNRSKLRRAWSSTRAVLRPLCCCYLPAFLLGVFLATFLVGFLAAVGCSIRAPLSLDVSAADVAGMLYRCMC